MPRIREFRWDSWAEWAVIEFEDDAPGIVAVDTETTGLEFYDQPFAATLTWRDLDGELKSAYFDLESEGREQRIKNLRWILQLAPAWVFHNAKFDLQKLRLIGAITDEMLERVELHDTQTMYHLLDENGRKGLKHLAVHVLKYDDTITVPYKSGPKKGQTREVSKEKYRLDEARRRLKLRKEDGYHLLPRDVLIPYALRDTEFTLALYERLLPRLQSKDEELMELYRSSMRLKRVLLRMEADGFRLDVPYLEETASEYGVRVMDAWQRIVEMTGQPELNPQSPAQLQQVFAARGHRLESTNEATLRDLDDDLARAVLEYRSVKKLHTTYLIGLLASQREGLTHPNFNDDGARTGRMSSGGATG